jgi:ribonuclease G
VLRDVLNKDFTSIHVDDELLAEEIYQTLEKTAPEKKGIVKHYKGNLDIFDHFGVNQARSNKPSVVRSCCRVGPT